VSGFSYCGDADCRKCAAVRDRPSLTTLANARSQAFAFDAAPECNCPGCRQKRGEYPGVTVLVKVKTPAAPDYLRIADSHGRTDSTLVNVGDLTDDELKEVGKAWTAQLLENAHKARKCD
jgi:hypothetical protein